MISSFKFLKNVGWIYDKKVNCVFCGREIQTGETALWMESRGFVCDKCFTERREKGQLWNVGAMVPVKIVDEIPQELREIDKEKEW
jgi:hypothetical protein